MHCQKNSQYNLFITLTLIIYLCIPSYSSQIYQIKGTILDQTGAAIIGAKISFKNGTTPTLTTITDSSGDFILDQISVNNGTLEIEAKGFKRTVRSWNIKDSDASHVRIVLSPAIDSEQVTITANRSGLALSDTASSIFLLSAEDLSSTAALTLDDALRQTLGFQLFRRSSSRTANPTSQGVSLRGVGASGASRALVLYDGIPLNDPFGGWIYWDRVPRVSVDRIEILRGGASDLYGSSALGGTINIITEASKIHEHPYLLLDTSYGNQQTPSASISTGGEYKRWGANLSAEIMQTDGYIPVDERERGTIDIKAYSEHSTLDLNIYRKIFQDSKLFIRGAIFDEDRGNGTPLQKNNTYLRQLTIGGDHQTNKLGNFSTRAYISTQVYNQHFSSIATDRNSETITRSQRVPAQATGFTTQWSHAIGSRHLLVAGLDGREVRGISNEIVFAAGRSTSIVNSGGRERTIGVFGQDLITITPRLLLTLGMRADRWRNFAAQSTTQSLIRPLFTTTPFPDREETAFSPRISLLYKLTNNLSIYTSGYRAFRAPTLNELYRSFRVGDVLTLANERLRAEHLTGIETGARFTTLDQRLNIRGTLFWSDITRPIANVTQTVTPSLITRQRQNLGRTRSQGVEIEGNFKLHPNWYISGGYQFTNAKVLEFPVNRTLEGLLIPQVPRHQSMFQLRYTNPSIATIGLQGRANGMQFDDDQNRFPLDNYFTLDLYASRRLKHGVDIYLAAENLFNERYEIGRTPVRTVGAPLLFRIGMRLNLGSF
jgi:outer membrane receptor protein involved in Fe transport